MTEATFSPEASVEAEAGRAAPKPAATLNQSSSKLDEPIDPEPFRRWCDAVIADPRGPDTNELAHELGVESRVLYRWRFESIQLERRRIEDALEHAGIPYWEIYGADEVGELEDDRYCNRCHDNVTPIDGVCPWCETKLESAGRARGHCRRCDRIVVPTADGSCWRCGTGIHPIPWCRCDCGCGREIPAFDPQGRHNSYCRGHAPRSLERTQRIPVEPFAAYLELELERLDLVGALARAHGIGRDEVVRVLKRSEPDVDRALVRRALWVASRGGTGKGLPPRPDAIKFSELYPDEVRKKVCPGCGGGKAPHAELCKQCRIKADRRDGVRRAPRAQTRIRPELLIEAYRHYSAGNSIAAAARLIFARTAHTNIGSTTAALSREWRRRGWKLRERRSNAAATR